MTAVNRHCTVKRLILGTKLKLRHQYIIYRVTFISSSRANIVTGPILLRLARTYDLLIGLILFPIPNYFSEKRNVPT